MNRRNILGSVGPLAFGVMAAVTLPPTVREMAAKPGVNDQIKKIVDKEGGDSYRVSIKHNRDGSEVLEEIYVYDRDGNQIYLATPPSAHWERMEVKKKYNIVQYTTTYCCGSKRVHLYEHDRNNRQLWVATLETDKDGKSAGPQFINTKHRLYPDAPYIWL